jgi:hypothetical protein
MTAIIDFLQANPLYAAGLVVLLLFFIISLVTKAIKLVVVAVILNIGYGYYLHDISDAYQQANQKVESAMDTVKSALD